MEIPSICRYCGGKIIKSTTRALYPKGREPIYLCVNCNAYVGCYADVCSNLYARTIRIGREMGYTRFLTYTLPEESGSSLRAVGFQVDGVVHSPSGGWNAPSRPRSTRRYPSGDKVRWVLHTP